jgi:hypothetical protein
MTFKFVFESINLYSIGVGTGVEAVGGKMISTGLKAKAIGAHMIKGF